MTFAAATPASVEDRWGQRTPLTLHLDHLAIEGLMSALGRRPDGSGPRALPDELKRLTDRELTVLGLVAEGHTNREIGETLFISEKTASVHVSRILAKLGVRSRVEAATSAHRLGLAATSAPGHGGRG